MPDHPIRAGCYVRVSTENQIENYSIEEQIDRLKAFCYAKGWTVVKFYTDAGYSGGNTDRPALKQMLQDIAGKKIDSVVVYKLDRLSRSQKDTLMLIEDEFLAHGVNFISMSENFDTSTAFGKAMIGMLSVFAQLEKDQITERFTMGRIGRGKAGMYHGGPTAPTGYIYQDGKLLVDEYKAAQVREVFDLFLRGRSINSIQRRMQEKYGGWSSHSLVLRVLRNSVYIGKVKFKGVEYDGIHTPILEKETFEKAQALLRSSPREAAKTTPQKTPFRAGYLLSSLVYCGNCGARYSANHGYYKCYSRSKSSARFVKDPNCKNDNWRIEELDNVVLTQLYHMIFDEDYFDANFTGSASEAPDPTQIQNRIKQIDAQISKMIDLYQIGELPIEQISARVKRLQLEKDSLENQLSEKPADKEAVKQRFMGARDELQYILRCGIIEEQRLFVSSFVDKVFIRDGSVEIAWRF